MPDRDDVAPPKTEEALEHRGDLDAALHSISSISPEQRPELEKKWGQFGDWMRRTAQIRNELPAPADVLELLVKVDALLEEEDIDEAKERLEAAMGLLVLLDSMPSKQGEKWSLDTMVATMLYWAVTLDFRGVGASIELAKKDGLTFASACARAFGSNISTEAIRSCDGRLRREGFPVKPSRIIGYVLSGTAFVGSSPSSEKSVLVPPHRWLDEGS